MSQVSIKDAYVQYADDLVAYASVLVPRTAAADVVADTFADLVGRPSGAWSTVRDPRAFLFGAVANRARMHHRQTQRRRQRELRLVSASPPRVNTVVDDPPGELSTAFERLSVQQRAVVYLTYWEDMSVAQVAASLDVSDGTVRRQLARARKHLREVLS